MRNQVEESESTLTLPPGKDSEVSMNELIASSQTEIDSLITRYDAYNDVMLSFTFLIEHVEKEVNLVAEQGAQAFRRRDLDGVKRASLDLVNAQLNERRVFGLRQDWLRMKDVGDALSQHGSETSCRHVPHMLREHESEDAQTALTGLIDRVDMVVDVLSECGAEAFAARDFSKVDRYRQHAMSVIDFKTCVLITRADWYKPADARAGSKSVSTQTTESVTAPQPTKQPITVG